MTLQRMFKISAGVVTFAAAGSFLLTTQERNTCDTVNVYKQSGPLPALEPVEPGCPVATVKAQSENKRGGTCPYIENPIPFEVIGFDKGEPVYATKFQLLERELWAIRRKYPKYVDMPYEVEARKKTIKRELNRAFVTSL